MLRYKTAIKTLIPLIIGIITGSFLQLELIIPFTLWCTFFITLLIVHFSGREIYNFRKLIGVNIMLLFFITGVLNYSLNSPKLNPKSIENVYLPQDKTLLTIEELNYGQGNFYKSISKVNGIVRGKDTLLVEGKILHFIHKDYGLLETGDLLSVSSLLQPITNKGNPGEFNQEAFWFNHFITLQTFSQANDVEIIGSTSTFSGFWENIRNYLIAELEKKVSPDVLGLVTALSLGDKSLLNKEVRENFANAGAMHVLAVSGLHVGILLGIIQYLCKFFSFLRKNYRYLYVSLVIIWLYAMLTGLSPSVSRAALMFSILAIGRANGNSFFSMNSLLVSALLLLLYNPLLIYHIGFQLSYFAMFGIVFFHKNICSIFYIENKWIRKIWDGTSLGIAAQIGTAPLSLYYFHQFPNFFMLTNIVFIVLAGVALGIVLLYFVVHFIPFISDLIAEGINLLYAIIIDFVGLINKLPFNIAKGFTVGVFSLIVFYLIVSLLIYFRQQQRIKPFTYALIALFFVATSFVYNRHDNLNAQEFIILNHKYQVVLVKYPGGTYCLYDQNAINDEESVAFDVDLFHKKYGGKIDFEVFPTEEKKYKQISFLNNEVNIITENHYTEISVNGKSIILPRKSYLPKEIESSGTIVSGFFSKFYKGKQDHNLQDSGAFRIKF
jgi:competence protein ComEC